LPQDWEDIFRRWSKPSSDTEAEKQANAERMIRAALGDCRALDLHEIKIIPQGSYRNNTNVRQESDVDICVCCMDQFFYDLSFADYGKTEANIIDSPYSYSQFKNDVQLALQRKFGTTGMSRGNKAFDIHENTYRVDADVVCAFAYRLYLKRTLNPLTGTYTLDYVLPPGTKFYSDTGSEVTNWPEQQYSNGVAKNTRTGNKFKSIVRAVKSLKYEMDEKGILAAKAIPSFLIECLIYNISDDIFKHDSYVKIVRDCIAICFTATRPEGACQKWMEVNGIKYLFHPAQTWTREQVNDFALAAWSYCGFS